MVWWTNHPEPHKGGEEDSMSHGSHNGKDKKRGHKDWKPRGGKRSKKKTKKGKKK